MAYMNQEKKKAIAAELKKVMPKDWKYSLSVSNHSAIKMKIRSAPVILPENQYNKGYLDLNVYHWENSKLLELNPEIRPIIDAAIRALNHGNWDNSDVMTDYFDKGHYVNLTFGEWDKPFVSTK